ncbi:helix-turn-helix domain-containing protein [Planococcus donghaensis]|uniref:helix-turn-helix domain-containing protein n=1 Tax=Planococcus donghaensis TaxID=414778 RepID=UPI0037359424
MNFTGDFFRMTRNMLHLSQQEFADKLGIHRTHLTRIETGHTPVSEKTETKFLYLMAEMEINLFELVTTYDSFLRINNQKQKRGNLE